MGDGVIMLNIGFDLDGVIYDYHYAAHRYVTSFIDIDYNTFWANVDAFNEIWWDNLILLPHLYNKIPVGKEVLETLNYFSRDNFLYYITSRSPELEFVTNLWMKNNRIPQRHNIFFSKDKRIEISELELDYFIEDRDTHDYRNYTNMILIRKPGNEKSQSKYTCISYLEELKDIIK